MSPTASVLARPPSRLGTVKTLKVALKNCHGIRELDATFSFETGNAVAVYAGNGTMKTSFARTLDRSYGGFDD